ncbi:hypothetical protein H101_08005 [Trichophyton interdigitale H6]|nr:hypothetical protein H101_08005 [Trichophyton interdigitale H6]
MTTSLRVPANDQFYFFSSLLERLLRALSHYSLPQLSALPFRSFPPTLESSSWSLFRPRRLRLRVRLGKRPGSSQPRHLDDYPLCTALAFPTNKNNLGPLTRTNKQR